MDCNCKSDEFNIDQDVPSINVQILYMSLCWARTSFNFNSPECDGDVIDIHSPGFHKSIPDPVVLELQGDSPVTVDALFAFEAKTDNLSLFEMVKNDTARSCRC